MPVGAVIRMIRAKEVFSHAQKYSESSRNVLPEGDMAYVYHKTSKNDLKPT